MLSTRVLMRRWRDERDKKRKYRTFGMMLRKRKFNLYTFNSLHKAVRKHRYVFIFIFKI
jgi:hypothetical protein